jgi:hypothetical protein
MLIFGLAYSYLFSNFILLCYLLLHSSLNSFPYFLCYFISFRLPLFLISIFSMETFHVDGWPKLTILVDGTDTTIVTEKCLYAMFSF